LVVPKSLGKEPTTWHLVIHSDRVVHKVLSLPHQQDVGCHVIGCHEAVRGEALSAVPFLRLERATCRVAAIIVRCLISLNDINILSPVTVYIQNLNVRGWERNIQFVDGIGQVEVRCLSSSLEHSDQKWPLPIEPIAFRNHQI